MLLPILRGAADFTRDLRRGEIGDAGYWMNGRGDSSSSSAAGTTGRGDGTAGKVGVQKFDRVEAFGGAVPLGTKIGRGLDGPAEENVFPVEVPVGVAGVGTEDAGRGAQLQQGGGVGDGDIDEFMNLDRLEEGYVQQFGGEGGGGQFYGEAMGR